MIKRYEMDRDETSLLLYMEACLVDNRGKMNNTKLNDEDRLNMNHWRQLGFVKTSGLWVEFTEEAWRLAHQLRRERAERHVDTIQAVSDE